VAEELREAFGVDPNLIPGKSGTFDVFIEGKLVFSKFDAGRFPEPGEIAGKLKG